MAQCFVRPSKIVLLIHGHALARQRNVNDLLPWILNEALDHLEQHGLQVVLCMTAEIPQTHTVFSIFFPAHMSLVLNKP